MLQRSDEWPRRPTASDYRRAPEAGAFATGAFFGFLTGALVTGVLVALVGG